MFSPNLTTQAELEDAWRELMGPWSFSGHSVWMMHVVDDRPFPQLTEIAETEEPPDTELVDGLVKILSMLDREHVSGARVAFLRSRPGKDVITDTDRAWATKPVRRRAARGRALRGRPPRHARRDPTDPRGRDRPGVAVGVTPVECARMTSCP